MAVTPRLPPHTQVLMLKSLTLLQGHTNFQFSISFCRRKQMPLSGLPSRLGRSLSLAARVGPRTPDAGARF